MELNVAQIDHPTGPVFYAVPSDACLWRVRTFFTKEPDTLEWIAEMNPGDVFVDVGANVGMYSLWAAKTAGARVFAFEPEAQNFAILNQNIAANRSDAIAYPLALADADGIGPLFLSGMEAGGSCHAFGEAIDFKGLPMRAKFVQGAVSQTLDALVRHAVIPQPDFIKIDVDGFEHRIVAGGREAVRHARSVLIEVNTNLAEHRDLVGEIEDMGFAWDRAEAAKARRDEGPFRGIGNVIFRR